MEKEKRYERDINNKEHINTLDRNWNYHSVKKERRMHFKTKRSDYNFFIKTEGKLLKHLNVKKYNRDEAKYRKIKLQYEKRYTSLSDEIIQDYEYTQRCKSMAQREFSAYERAVYTV